MLRCLLAVWLVLMPSLAFAQEGGMGIVAVVNDDVISSLDVEERMAYAMATSNMPDSPAMRANMRRQMLKMMIDETLQLQEAKRQNLEATDDEVAGAILSINQQRGHQSGAFESFLASRGVPLSAVERQLKAQVSWQKVVGRSIRPRVRISEQEVQIERERIALGKRISEVQISSVFLPVEDAKEEPSVLNTAENLVKAAREGADFKALAQQFSFGSPDLIEQNQERWVQPHQLEPVLARVVAGLGKGEISPPIRSLSGYHIIKLHDARSANTAQSSNSEVLLKQMVLHLPENAAVEDAEKALGIAREVARRPNACTVPEAGEGVVAKEADFDVTYQRMEFQTLQPHLQNMLINLRVGDVSEPFAAPDGIHMVQLCERVEMPMQLPPVEEVRQALTMQKIESDAEKLMRNLRRDALIEIRL